jgi:hypothetical protein
MGRVPGGLAPAWIRRRRPENISRCSVRWSGPAISSAITTSSNEVAKANSAPEATAGTIDGNVTRKNVVVGVAPHAAAARARFGSRRKSELPGPFNQRPPPSTSWYQRSEKPGSG